MIMLFSLCSCNYLVNRISRAWSTQANRDKVVNQSQDLKKIILKFMKKIRKCKLLSFFLAQESYQKRS
jgi:hypothetical protein